MIDERTSRLVSAIKALAMLSVICAHCNNVASDASKMNVYAHYFLNIIGTIGVGIFFCVSGYLFVKCTNKQCGLKEFLIKKAFRLLLPWLLCGTLVYFYVVLRKGGMSFESWAEFLMGKGSYLYFVPVLFVLYIIGYFIYNSPYFLGGAIVLSIFSNILTELEILPTEFAVMNVLNWLCYFAIGIVIAKRSFFAFKCFGYIALFFSVLTVIILTLRNYWLTYWTPGYIVFEVVAGVGLCMLADLIVMSRCKRLITVMCKVGGATMAIYLLHMPIAGIVANLCGRFDLWFLTLLRPLIVLCITGCGLWIYKMIVEKMLKKGWLLTMVGLR